MRKSFLAPSMALALAALAAAPPGLAQPAKPVSDTVDISLSVEQWVKAETARVILVVDVAGQGEDGGVQRADIIKAASSVADKADWRVIAMEKVSDSAGLDRWRTALEARLPESMLAALAERAKRASRPGLQIRVGAIKFEPTLPELETVRSAMRQRLYARIKEEIVLLQQTFPDRQYRVESLRFDISGGPQQSGDSDMPAGRPQRGGVEEIVVTANRLGGAGGGGQEDKLVMEAMVTLGSFITPPP